jgi:hypothetical protein
MVTTKRSISPRITDETINPPLEDTVQSVAPTKVVVEQEVPVNIKGNNLPILAEWMAKYGKTQFIVPTNGKNDSEPEFVSINGNDFYIDKGIFLDLPINVASLLADKYRIQMNLGREHRIDGNKEKMERLG